MRHRAPASGHGQEIRLSLPRRQSGIANVILTPDVFERDRIVVTCSRFLRIEGTLQNQGGVIHVKAQRIGPLDITSAVTASHDFH